MKTIELVCEDKIEYSVNVEDEKFGETMRRARLSAEMKTRTTGKEWKAREKSE